MQFMKKLGKLYKHPAPLKAVFSRLMSSNIGSFRFSHHSPKVPLILALSVVLGGMVGMFFILVRNATQSVNSSWLKRKKPLNHLFTNALIRLSFNSSYVRTNEEKS